MARLLPLLLLTAVLACGSPDFAPAALDDLLPWGFQNFDAASDADFALGFVHLADAAADVGLGNPLKGQLRNRLTPDNIAYLNLTPRDPSRAQGLFILNSFKCTLPQLEKILIARNQMDLFPDQYDSYDSHYTTNAEAYKARKEKFVQWQTQLRATKGIWSMTETLNGALRYIPDLGKDKSPWGATLVARTVMPDPAVFDDADKKWLQDYQIEFYFERDPERIVHGYGMWREVDLGAFFHSDSDGFVDKVTSALIDWDKMTEDDCLAGKP